MWVVFMSVLGMLCWGVAPVFGKLGLGRLDPMTGLSLRTMIAAGVVGGWMILSGQLQRLQPISKETWILIGLESLFATLLGDLAYFAALKWGNTAEVSLIMAASPLITMCIALAFLGEEVTWPKLVGSALIVGGLLLIGLPAKSS